MAKTDPRLVEVVCRPHCRFFKPGEKEELSCGGYDFLVKKLGPDLITILAKKFGGATPPASFKRHLRIAQTLCTSCPFREDDCDFMSSDPPPNAVPCGGYVLLARMIAEGMSEIEKWLDD